MLHIKLTTSFVLGWLVVVPFGAAAQERFRRLNRRNRGDRH